MSTSITKKIQELVVESHNGNLYVSLLHQINKDLNLCGMEWNDYLNIAPDQLFEEVRTIVSRLLNGSLNSDIRTLLYRIDVSEKALRQIENLGVDEITTLVLEREMQKIWLKHKYSNS